VLGLLSEVAGERPVVCVVDDAQWLDRASAQVLAVAVGRLGAKKLQWIEGATARWDGYLEFQRRPQPMLEWLPDGYASDNGTGLIFEGTDLVDCVTEVDGARTWQMTRRDDGTVEEIPLPTRLLSS
jgi:hypothetical protein